MSDHPTPDQAGQDQPRHGGHATIIPDPDGCRTITLHHITEGELWHVLRAAYRAGVDLPSPLIAEMIRQGIIRPSGRRSKRPQHEREALAFRACALAHKGEGRTWAQAGAKVGEDGNQLWRWHDKSRGKCPHCAMR